MRKKRKKKDYKRPVIVGFLALYLVSMLLSTYLVKCKYEEEYNTNLYSKRDEYYENFTTLDIDSTYWTEEMKDDFAQYANMLCAQIGCHDKYQQMSAAIYDIQGNRIAMTSNVFGYIELHVSHKEEGVIDETIYRTFEMEMYMTEKEIRELSAYYDSSSEVFEETETEEEHLAQGYMALIYMGADSSEPMELTEPMNLSIMERTVDGIGEASVSGTSVSWKPVWQWSNKNVSGEKTHMPPNMISDGSGVLVYFPYITHGTKYWDIWQQDEWLQGFCEKYERGSIKEESTEEGLVDEVELLVSVGGPTYSTSTVNMYRICLRQTAHPWLAAIDYMKYVYAMGLLVTLACIIKVLYSTHKTYEQRERLEQTRRDFTNAAAHELKTPLSVIRGFAENLKENTVEEKRDYYLDQIILQTEQMDELVKQMIHVSKLDSDQLELKKESISLIEMIKEQIVKLDTLIEEKNLRIIYEVEQDFVLEGDSAQMEKMIWNLLSNAVEYNRQDGSIWIFANENRIAIENTGTPILEEKLDHIFEMFYTGDESRHERSRHLGLGLYLAKRISDMHGLKLAVYNMDAGVRAVIQR